MTSPRNVLLAYVECGDLETIAERLEQRFATFIAGRKWNAKEVHVVNQRHSMDTETDDRALPYWDLGLNFTLPDKKESDDGWIEDVHATVDFLSVLNEQFGCDFVIAVHDRVRGYNEDVAYVESDPPELREILFMIDAHRA